MEVWGELFPQRTPKKQEALLFIPGVEGQDCSIKCCRHCDCQGGGKKNYLATFCDERGAHTGESTPMHPSSPVTQLLDCLLHQRHPIQGQGLTSLRWQGCNLTATGIITFESSDSDSFAVQIHLTTALLKTSVLRSTLIPNIITPFCSAIVEPGMLPSNSLRQLWWLTNNKLLGGTLWVLRLTFGS